MPGRTPRQAGYTLVVCEKPDVARRVSEALSDGSATGSTVDGTTVFRFVWGGEQLVVCSAQGHLYAVSDPFEERTVYPIFDLEWYPSDLVEAGAGAGRRVAAIRKLAEGASKFVNACDLDVEGETIGYNILRYACGGKEEEALRAKFSTLTKEDLVTAFREAASQGAQGMARAGRARHAIDFVWGINLSRALSQSALGSGRRFRTVSIGRVQGPSLNFLVEREREIRTFVPVPFWKLSGTFGRGGAKLVAEYSRERILTKSEAEEVKSECADREAIATKVAKITVLVPPPSPFNIGDLQREAYRAFGLLPVRTMQAAEKLYLDALISYPRTGSQRLPPSTGFARILRGLSGLPQYSVEANELLRGELRPAQGTGTDLAHPAIHPTGEKPRRAPQSAEASIFDLVVRRFLSTFGPPARREAVRVEISVGAHKFTLVAARTVFLGWLAYYRKYSGLKDLDAPRVEEGDRFKVAKVEASESFDQPQRRYNQATLLGRMESERIGTKATRADIISTLVERGYVEGQSMEVTDLGLAVIEIMKKYAPPIATTELTRKTEGELEAVEEDGIGDADLMRSTIRSMSEQLLGLIANEEEVGRELDRALTSSAGAQDFLGPCPVCKDGTLRVVRSVRTKKRFVGCSNYPSGCRASAPLPQRGTIKVAGNACAHCSWPMVHVMGGRRPWKLCVNPSCPSKARRRA
ncbi:MAG: DNA topoisomerase I [Thaumarchaeota archaeon]|nr:DNA topoisomerase I [Nitrososphaerota archaeon]